MEGYFKLPKTEAMSLEDIPQARWDVASIRESIIKPLVRSPPPSEAEIAQAGKQLNLTRSSIYRLLAAYRKRPQTTTLLPGIVGRRENTRVIAADIEAVMQTA